MKDSENNLLFTKEHIKKITLKKPSENMIEEIYNLLSNIPQKENDFTNEFYNMDKDKFFSEGISKIINNKLTDQKIQTYYYFLFDDNELIGIFKIIIHLENDIENNITNNTIEFFIKKEKRNLGYSKIGLHLSIKEANILLPKEVEKITIKVNKKDIYSYLSVLGNNAEISLKDENYIYFAINRDNNLWIHKLTVDYMKEIIEITDQAKELIRKNGGSFQWQQGYPNEESFKSDILKKELYGIFEDFALLGFGAYKKGLDVNYIDIDGKWDIPPSDNDMVIHRVAVSQFHHGKNLGYKMLRYGIYKGFLVNCSSIKIDTHRVNKAMKKCIDKNGFGYKGIVKFMNNIPEDRDRDAYEIDVKEYSLFK